MPRLARTVVPGCAHQIAQRWPKFDYEYAANTSNIANMAYNHRGDSNEVDYSYDDLNRLTLAEYSVTDDRKLGTATNGMKIRTHGSRSQKGFSHFVSWSV
jgi:hypothetical protein